MDVLKKIKTIRLLRLLAPMLAGLALAYGLVVFVLSLNDGVSTTFLKWTVLGLALFTFAVVVLISMFTGKQARSLADYVIEVEKQYNSDDKIIRTLSKKYNAVYYADLDSGDVRFLEIGNRVASYMSEVYREKHNLEWYARAYADRILEGYQKEKFLGEVNCDNLKEKLRTREVYYFKYEAEKDGKTLYFQMEARRIDGDHTKAVVGFEDIGREIEETMTRNKLLTASLADASSASKVRDIFLQNMSHEMRTPLNSIVGYAHLIERDCDDVLVKERTTVIRQESDLLLNMIDNLLTASQVKNGKRELRSLPRDMNVAIREIKEDAKQYAKLKGIPIEFEEHFNSGTYCVDIKMLHSVVMAVIENAINYSDKGLPVRVIHEEEACKRDDAIAVKITVEDKGIGMDKETIAKAFEPFERERSTTESGIQGTGVGLTIAKAVIEMMGGSIDISSEKGVGTTVVIRAELEKTHL